MNSLIPETLKQKCEQVTGTSRYFNSNNSPKLIKESGKFLLWRGIETKYFWTTTNKGKFFLYNYEKGTEASEICIEHDFGSTATINDVLYFPISFKCHGVAVALSDHGKGKYPDYIAYFSLKSKRLLKCVHVAYPITKLQSVLDGTAAHTEYLELATQFHSGWPHLLLIGCRFGYAYIIHLDITVDDTDEDDDEQRILRAKPVKSQKTIPLSKIFDEDDMFVFRSDEGMVKCMNKHKTSVTALHYIEKSKLIIIGFNFGGILSISLKTSKTISQFYLDGSVEFFASQEPEEDPRPIIFFWTCIHSQTNGPLMLLLTITFPKDEGLAPKNYTYSDPCFSPNMKWQPDLCSQMLSVRTLYVDKKRSGNLESNEFGLDYETREDSYSGPSGSYDTNLLLMVWEEIQSCGTSHIHGSLFDLNAYYAKRLIGRVVPDNTIARQLPFFSRFSTTKDFLPFSGYTFDMLAVGVTRFSPPAFLKDTIDQLFYPSTYHISIVALTAMKVGQLKVQSIQSQLISTVAQKIEEFFDQPTTPCRWIYSLGLANSEPARGNLNEERACLLRVLVHNYFPGLLILIEKIPDSDEDGYLKFIQRWIWKEIEITKKKFDEYCAPLFSSSSWELSPSTRGYIQHARIFFKRATLILEALEKKTADLEDKEWNYEIAYHRQAARQLQIYSCGVAFTIVYELLPLNSKNTEIYNKCNEEFIFIQNKAQENKQHLGICKILAEIIKATPNEDVWQEKQADEWFPPPDFAHLLPILLLMNITETSKLTVLGYYCLQLECHVSSDSFRSNLFSKFLAFFEGSIELFCSVRNLWRNDQQTINVDSESAEKLIQTHSSPSSGLFATDDSLKYLSLCLPEEVEYAKKQYLKLDYGVFLFNMNAILKKRYELLLDLPLPEKNEPEFVRKCRIECMELRKKFHWIFEDRSPLPDFVVERYKENLVHDREVKVTRKRSINSPRPIKINVKRRGQIASFSETNPLIGARNMNELPKDQFGQQNLSTYDNSNDFNRTIENIQELPLTMATPAKRQRLMLFSDINSEEKDGGVVIKQISKSAVKAKHIDRISRVISTPLSLQKRLPRVPIRNGTHLKSARNLFDDIDTWNKETDVFSTPNEKPNKIPFGGATPVSILKSEKKSRLTSSARLRFASALQTENIPSRAEKLFAERQDNSFTNFADSSASEASALFDTTVVLHKNFEELEDVFEENDIPTKVICVDQTENKIAQEIMADPEVELETEIEKIPSKELKVNKKKSEVKEPEVNELMKVKEPEVNELTVNKSESKKRRTPKKETPKKVAPNEDDPLKTWTSQNLRRSTRVKSPRKFV